MGYDEVVVPLSNGVSEMKILATEIVTTRKTPMTILVVQSESNPNKTYRVDASAGRCSCPGWIYSRTGAPCKHLRQLGISSMARTPRKADVAPAPENYAEQL